MARYRSLVAVAGTLAIAAGGLTGTAAAVGTETCNPTPHADASFCVTYGVGITQPGTSTPETHAAAPADLTIDLDNTSTHAADDGTHSVWLKQIEVSLLSGLGGHAYALSSQLPNGLIIAGSTTNCGSPPDVTACDGYGGFFALVSGSGVFDGVRSGTFGVQRVENINPPAASTNLDWNVTIDFCLSTSLGSCTDGAQRQVIELRAAAPSGANNGDNVTMPASVIIQPASGITVDASIDNVHLLLHGQSDTVSSGTPPAAPVTVLHLPTRCGTAAADAVFTDRADTTVNAPLKQSVTGCPTARFAKAEHLLTAHFDGTTSTSPITGRTITKWHWSFGDGTSRVTTGPKVAHTYASSRNRTVRLVVEDSLGALSTARSWLLRGSAMTWAASASRVKPGTAVTLSGRLTKWHSTTGLGGRKVTIQRCRVGTNHCTLVKTVTTSRHSGRVGKFSVVVHPTAAGDYRATYFGGGGYLGIRKSHRITMS